MEKGEIDERRKIELMDVAGGISSCLSPVIDIILAVLNSQHRRLNLVVFILLAVILLAGGIWWWISFAKKSKAIEKSFKSKKKKLKKEWKKGDKKNDREMVDKDYYDKKAEIRKQHDIILKKRNATRRRMIILFSLGMICSLIMIGVQIFFIVRDEGGKGGDGIGGAGVSGTGTGSGIGMLDEHPDNEGATPEQIEMMRNKKFILNDPDRTVVLSKEDEEEVFYITSIDPEICGREVSDHIEEIYNQEKSSTFSEGSVEKAMAREAQSEEDAFLKDIDKAEEYRKQEEYEDWKKVVPNSGELDGIIEKREMLWRPSEEDMEFNGDTCFRLANNCQLYADEYSAQGGKPETVIAYYVESIKWTERGLAYKDIVKDRETYYKYLKARYKDIHDYIEKNSGKFGGEEEKYQEIGEKAGAIYGAM